MPDAPGKDMLLHFIDPFSDRRIEIARYGNGQFIDNAVYDPPAARRKIARLLRDGWNFIPAKATRDVLAILLENEL